MKIQILSRNDIEGLKGSEALDELLKFCRIISINNSEGEDSEPPFAEGVLPHPNVLTLQFDDIDGTEWRPFPDRTRYFCREDAERIADFVKDDTMPLIVHCHAGVSRSGAVGTALDWYYNEFLSDNPEDHENFTDANSGIRPNQLVLRIMKECLTDRARGGGVR